MTVLRRAPTACPIERAVHVLGGRWKTMIVYHLLPGPVRYGELRRRLPECAERVFVRQVRELEADGVVARVALEGRGQQVEYRLTPLGVELQALFDVMRTWGDRHLAAAATASAPPEAISATAAGTALPLGRRP